jgi:hypothetical protein
MMPGRGACHVEMGGGRRGGCRQLERHSDSFIEIALWGTVQEGEEKSRPVRRERTRLSENLDYPNLSLTHPLL